MTWLGLIKTCAWNMAFKVSMEHMMLTSFDKFTQAIWDSLESYMTRKSKRFTSFCSSSFVNLSVLYLRKRKPVYRPGSNQPYVRKNTKFYLIYLSKKQRNTFLFLVIIFYQTISQQPAAVKALTKFLLVKHLVKKCLRVS